MIYGIVNWDENLFADIHLPIQNIIYTQVYLNNKVWSIQLSFNKSPREEGLETIASVAFLVDSAPKEVLKKGFVFNIYDGVRVVGICEII